MNNFKSVVIIGLILSISLLEFESKPYGDFMSFLYFGEEG